VLSIWQGSAESGRGLRAMPPRGPQEEILVRSG